MTQTTAEAPQPTLIRSDYVVLVGGALAMLFSGLAHFLGWNSVVAFVISAAAVTLLASLVGRSVEQLGDRFGPGATGVLQSALGNLPELFIALFALQAHLIGVVKAAIVGSILANLLLVLGLAFVVGGLKHGTQKLGSERARTITVLMLLSVAALAFPSLTHLLHTPAAAHEKGFSVITSVVLLVLFALSLPFSLKRSGGAASPAQSEPQGEPPRWPVAMAVGLLALAGLAAAFVSDWFVSALTPAMHSLNISDAFAGLVIVAIAGNAIENIVGVQLAAKGNSEYAFSVILNSPLQIALVLAPVLVLAAAIFGLPTLTLVFSPLLVAALLLSVMLAGAIAFDGESNWLEGASLVALYLIIAGAFWWG